MITKIRKLEIIYSPLSILGDKPEPNQISPTLFHHARSSIERKRKEIFRNHRCLPSKSRRLKSLINSKAQNQNSNPSSKTRTRPKSKGKGPKPDLLPAVHGTTVSPLPELHPILENITQCSPDRFLMSKDLFPAQRLESLPMNKRLFTCYPIIVMPSSHVEPPAL